MATPFRVLAGSGLFSRAMRGTAFVAVGYAASQVLRLASNLILARLLFPEAFGLMALVTVFLIGLAMFSDVGLGPAIQSNPRGDDQRFLDTAWTLQAARGALLWGVTILVAGPAASFYRAPELAALLPAAGVTLLIAGLNPTRIETANRHLLLGRVTLLDLIAQAIGTVAMIVLAFATRSIWALVWGSILMALLKLVLMHIALPGTRNRLHWDASAARELLRFGGWIFLATACGFLLAQGDRAILGRYLSIEGLGIYNIGYFLASFPMLLAGAVTGRIMIPLYREVASSGAPAMARRLRQLRWGLSAAILCMLVILALAGKPLVGLLYDDRYVLAGTIVVLIACVQMIVLVGMTYEMAALAAGESRRFFTVIALRTLFQITLMLIGTHMAGVTGALAGQALAAIPGWWATAWLARRHGVWDPVHDACFIALAFSLGGLALWQVWPSLDMLEGL